MYVPLVLFNYVLQGRFYIGKNRSLMLQILCILEFGIGFLLRHLKKPFPNIIYYERLIVHESGECASVIFNGFKYSQNFYIISSNLAHQVVLEIRKNHT